MALTRGISDTHTALWASAAPLNATAGERERYILECARGFVCHQVAQIAEHGDQDEAHRLLDPYDALMRLATLHMLAVAAEPRPNASPSPPSKPKAEAGASRKPSANPPARLSKERRRSVKAAVGEKALRKALKYVFSTAMELRISVISTRPLRFALGPNERYDARYEAILSGKDARAEDSAARTIILRAAKDIVEAGLHVERLREWVPTVAWDQIGDPDIAEVATGALMDELKRKLDALITAEGPERFKRYAEGAP